MRGSSLGAQKAKLKPRFLSLATKAPHPPFIDTIAVALNRYIRDILLSLFEKTTKVASFQADECLYPTSNDPITSTEPSKIQLLDPLWIVFGTSIFPIL